jgi:hypothetical protein
MPKDSIFGDKGPAALAPNDDRNELLFLMGILNSKAFAALVSLQLARTELAQSFEVGVVQNTPVPECSEQQKEELVAAAKLAWSRKRCLDFVVETTSAFHLPAALLPRLLEYNPAAVADELSEIQAKIDAVVFDLYGFSDFDRTAVLGSPDSIGEHVSDDADDGEDDDSTVPISQTDGLLSWAIGVAFGRFDWRLATGEREAPPEPDPFDPLPAESPGMLPDGAKPFHNHNGILVNDQGHPHDLPRLIEEALARVQADVPRDVRNWLQRDFFPLHLKQYSKSRRKAPIYWPLATASGSYVVWLYYPSITSQTLYTAVNDFIEPKLAQLGPQTAALRSKGNARSREEDRTLEALQAVEAEVIELRDTLLRIAPTYRPNHDDGVQLTAAPLWPLFRHKPWQKLLKETWVKLEKGEYDWANLALAYWPDRVHERCKTDRSLAIAHDLEHLHVPPEPKVAKPRGRKKVSEA